MKIRTLAAIVALSLSLQAAADIKPLNSIAIEINSAIIMHSDILRVFNELKSRPTNGGIPDEQLLQAAKNHLVERTLLADAAHQMGLKVTEKQIDAELIKIAQAEKTTVSALYQKAATIGATQQKFRLEIAKNILIERMFADITDNIKISDAQIDQAIAEAKANGQRLPEGEPYTVYTIRRLLLNAVNQSNMHAVGERMQQIAHAITQGTPFKTLAIRYTQDSAVNGGLYNDITDGMLPAAAEELLHQMQPGQISTPIASGTTWQMFQLLHSRTETNPTKMQREAIRRALLQRERQKAQQQFIGQLQQNAVIREH